MRADLDTLLKDAGAEPRVPLDVDATWARGRRRRTVRRLSAAGGGLAGVAAIVLVASSMLGGLPGTVVPQIEPMAPAGENDPSVTDPDASSSDSSSESSESSESDAPSSSDSDVVTAEGDGSFDASGREPSSDADVSGGADAAAGDLSPSSTSDGGPAPDAARVADPCAVHTGGAMRNFIDVVAPVDGQQVNGTFELVGCASVYEGTIRYRLSDGDDVLVDSFTTATAGGPEIGEFREVIALERSGSLSLDVFWDSPKDGTSEGMTTVIIDAN